MAVNVRVYYTCACVPACLCVVCIVAYVYLCCLNAYFVFSPICLQKFPFYHLVYRWCAFMFARIRLLPRSEPSSLIHTHTHTQHTHTHVDIYIYIYRWLGLERCFLQCIRVYIQTCTYTYICIHVNKSLVAGSRAMFSCSCSSFDRMHHFSHIHDW